MTMDGRPWPLVKFQGSPRMKYYKRFRVKPGARVRLADQDADCTCDVRDKAEAEKPMQRNLGRLSDLQYLLYAEGRRALLIVLQGMDAGGKDGTIRHVMSGLNPQSCRVTSFKVPSATELAHDFLWRIHAAVPEKGEIGIFNRSHYEDVLVARVHGLVSEKVWRGRYEQINRFEESLSKNNIRILKFFLHISKAEQRKRLEERLKDPAKNWKISPADLAERKRWGEYVEAYEEALSRCSTDEAPWFMIPANHKWFRNLAVSQIVVEALEEMDMKFPPPSFDVSKVRLR
jgi:PPK2 family polyphosphate:nucleotide phosphotransferase